MLEFFMICFGIAGLITAPFIILTIFSVIVTLLGKISDWIDNL